MSLNATRWAWAQQDLTPSEKLTLLALADRANDAGNAWPSWADIAARTGLGRSSIARSLAKLKELGLITDTGMKRGKAVTVYRCQCGTDPSQAGTLPVPEWDTESNRNLSRTSGSRRDDSVQRQRAHAWNSKPEWEKRGFPDQASYDAEQARIWREQQK